MQKQDRQSVFVNKARMTHGDKFDYSLVQYVDSDTKVKIICDHHGVFEQTPAEHVRGRGCNACRMDGPKNFLSKARKVHGDKYDYSKVDYKRSSDQVEIICPKHGSFYQTPVGHITGYGCQKCGRESASKNARHDNTKFINSARSVHGDRYDYSQVDYVHCQTKVRIVCKEHGVFSMAPLNHVQQRQGCPQCGMRKAHEKRRLTSDEFLERAKLIHGDKYDYRFVEYTDFVSEVKIVCRVHGVFTQVAGKHIGRGDGCPHCSPFKKLTREEILVRAEDIHGTKYRYDKFQYKNVISPVVITCIKHGDFKTTIHKHINSGVGCPRCRESKGEMRVRNWLDRRGITYKSQWNFKSGEVKRMRFDFVIWHNKTVFIVEYQGRQHYEPSSFSSDHSQDVMEKNFLIIQERDKRKRDWCESKNVPLLAIPYWEFNNIELVLENFLNAGHE